MNAAVAQRLRQKHRAELPGADQADTQRVAVFAPLMEFCEKVHGMSVFLGFPRWRPHSSERIDAARWIRRALGVACIISRWSSFLRHSGVDGLALTLQCEAFVAASGDLGALFTVDVHATRIRHEDTRFAGNVGTEIP